MGARVHFVFQTELNKPNIVLYSHWGEESWREDLSMAILKAQRRLDMGDTSYALRIMIDQLSKEGRDEETGFGIYLAEQGTLFADTSVEVDLITQMVNDEGNWHSFNSFTEYHLEEIPANHSFDTN
jgi:hypothetical protein